MWVLMANFNLWSESGPSRGQSTIHLRGKRCDSHAGRKASVWPQAWVTMGRPLLSLSGLDQHTERMSVLSTESW